MPTLAGKTFQMIRRWLCCLAFFVLLAACGLKAPPQTMQGDIRDHAARIPHFNLVQAS